MAPNRTNATPAIMSKCGSCSWFAKARYSILLALRLLLLMEEIDAINRKRTYKQVPNKPAAASGQPRLTA